MTGREHVRQAATVFAILAWLGALGWSTYEVILTRTLRADNTWAVADGAVVVLATLLLATWALLAWRQLKLFVRLGASVPILILGAVTVGMVSWVVQAPLPEQHSVPLPPPSASPQVVVRTFVTALDQHDRATAEALYAPSWFSSSNTNLPDHDLDLYVRVWITHLSPPQVDTNDASLPRGVTGVDVNVTLGGWNRDGGPVGEDGVDGHWGYVLAPIGFHGSWRIIDEGFG